MSGLNRIILIDTHLPGVVELKLDSHTNICGTNASGKTTLQRLVPVFYGEYPSRVVPSTRDSFEKWYLRNESSYIIYEYVRPDSSMCQVVLTSGGKGVDYRFIGKAFDLSDYTFSMRSGEHKIILPSDLGRAMKREGVACSRMLNTREFRAIIQNDRAVLIGSRDLPSYASMFSLAEPSNNLRHIEKLAKAVHSKEGKMETIKAMVAAILEEDGIRPPVNNIKLSAVENWIKERKLIKGFEGLRPEFLKLQQEHEQFGLNTQRLAELKEQFKLDKSIIDKDLTEAQTQLEELSLDSRQTEKAWSENRDELNNELSQAKGDIAKLEGDLDKLEETYDDWQAQDVEQLSDNLRSLSSWKSELEGSEATLSLMTEKHKDLQSALDKRLREISENLSGELEGFDVERQSLSDSLLLKSSEQQTQETEIKNRYQTTKSETSEDYQSRLAQIANQKTELQTLLNNAGFTEQEEQQLVIFEANIQEAFAQEDIAREALRKAEKQIEECKHKQSESLHDLQQAEKEEQRLQKAVDSVESLLFPGHDTLLEYLRRENPDWADSIGKVINPELLNRTDLKPAFAEKSDSLYGLVLDLLSVELPECADSEQSLQQKLVNVQQEHSEAVEVRNEGEAKLSELNMQMRDAELGLSKAKTQANNAEQTRKRTQLDKDTLQKEFQQAKSERKQSYKKQLDSINKRQQKLESQLSEALENIDDELREALMECHSHWQIQINELKCNIEQLDVNKANAKQHAKLEKKQADKWFKDELANRDVDVKQIGKLKEKVETLTNDIKFTEKHRHKVDEYRHWHKVYYTEHKMNWQSQLNDAKKLSGELTRDLQNKQADYQEAKKLHDTKKNHFESQLKTAREYDEALKQINRHLQKLTLPTAELQTEKETLGQRISEGQQLLNNREDLERNIKAYVEHFDSQIAAQSGTGLSDIWEKSREECLLNSADGVPLIDHIKLVTHLDQLLNIHVPQHITSLKENGRIFGKNLAEFYHVLKSVESHIGNQSKRISAAVDEELFLDGVSDSAVKIRSKISELDFWPELQSFTKHYEAWIEEGAVELPGDEYAHGMRTVLDILGRSALEGGISKLLDIELHIHEGNSALVIRTDRQLNESSSHGMAYLILCKFLLAFTRLLRGQSEAIIHWPIDELGTLHQSNIKKIFDACQNNNILVLGAFPNPESEVLTLFNNRYLIANKDGQRRLQIVEPKVSAISKRLKKRKSEQPEVEETA